MIGLGCGVAGGTIALITSRNRLQLLVTPYPSFSIGEPRELRLLMKFLWCPVIRERADTLQLIAESFQEDILQRKLELK